MFQPRERLLEFSISHYDDKWYILTNKDKATNFKIMTCPENKTTLDNWVDLLPYDPNIFIQDIDIFKKHMVISERKEGITQIRIRPWNGDNEHYISFDDQSYSVYTSINPDFDTDILRIDYT